MLGRLTHVIKDMQEKHRWCEAIGETPTHYLVLIRNAGDGVSSHVHAVLKKDYRVDGAVDNGSDLI